MKVREAYNVLGLSDKVEKAYKILSEDYDVFEKAEHKDYGTSKHKEYIDVTKNGKTFKQLRIVGHKEEDKLDATGYNIGDIKRIDGVIRRVTLEAIKDKDGEYVRKKRWHRPVTKQEIKECREWAENNREEDKKEEDKKKEEYKYPSDEEIKRQYKGQSEKIIKEKREYEKLKLKEELKPGTKETVVKENDKESEIKKQPLILKRGDIIRFQVKPGVFVEAEVDKVGEDKIGKYVKIEFEGKKYYRSPEKVSVAGV